MLIEAKPAGTPDFHDLHKLFFGSPKCGKTKLASMLSRDGKPPLFILTEDGDRALSLHAFRVRCWKGFLAAKDCIMKSLDQVRREHSCVVIDLVGDLDDMVSRHVCEESGYSYIGDIPNGKGWLLQKGLIRQHLQEIMTAVPVVFLAHSKEKEIQSDDGAKKQIGPLMGSASYDFVCGKVDLIGHLKPIKAGAGGLLKLSMRPSESLHAGSRFPEIAKEYVLDISDFDSSISKIMDDLGRGFSGSQAFA